jgi:hypothetical protein
VQFIETVKALCCPKGVAVVSLNLTPGWLAMAATQRLLNDAGTGDNPLMERLVIARSFLENAAATGRQPELVAGAQKVGTFGDKYGQTYLAHEFLAGGWASGWTADLARDLAPLAFRATTYLDLLCDDFALTKAERAVLETAPTAAAALSYRDLAHGRAHARAVFQPLDAPQAANRLAGWLRLVGPADTLDYKCKTPAGALKFENALARRIVKGLVEGPRALAGLFTASEASSETAFWRVIDALSASGQVMPTDQPKPSDGVDRLAVVLAEAGINSRYRPDFHGTPIPVANPPSGGHVVNFRR